MTDQAAEIETEVVSTATEPASTDAVTETATATEDDALGEAFDRLTAERERDEQGRFASAEKPDGEKADPKPDTEVSADEVPAGDENADTPEKQSADQASSAPAHLPYDIKANWEGIPEAARTALVGLTTEQDRKFGELGREMATLKPVKEVVSEFGEYFDGTKGSYKPDEAMRYLFGLQRKMDSDPLGTIMDIANTYGVAGQLVQPTDGTREIAQLNQTIMDLKSQMTNQSNPETINTAVSQALDAREFNKALDEFAASKPFYTDVESVLVDNEETGRSGFISYAWDRLGETEEPLKVLEYAYDMAVNAIPEVRVKAQAAKAQNNSTANAVPDAKAANAPDPKRTDAARRAASINVKSTATGKQNFASEEDAMGSVYDRLTG